MAWGNIKLTATDEAILDSYKLAVEGLADYLGPGYEIVLHSLANLDESVIAIINGHYTGRHVGSPITDMALQMLDQISRQQGNSYISYFTRTKDGKPLKSTTIAIRGEEGRVIGLICMNLYLNISVAEFMGNLMNVDMKTGQRSVDEGFFNDAVSMIKATVQKEQERVAKDPSVQSTNRNREIILELNRKGIFRLKDSVQIVANQLGISKNTVYLHLRNLCEEGKGEPADAK